ncbi:MAG: peptide chain release factor N(5)-glutamine methyltransferase [Clostridiales bacterium]|nr:peptide chain release factor N(5)-glutamine methyltransferase [Clostridiales bacterium]
MNRLEYEECEAVSFRRACREAEHYLEFCKISDARVDAWYLLEYVTGITRAGFLADGDRVMNREQRDAYTALVNRRGSHIPLQYLTGEQEFMGLPFQVNEQVLIPRQDTETLVELALAVMDGSMQNRSGEGADQYRVLDLCTGSGCIAVSIARLWERRRTEKHLEKRLEVYASDISEEALATARENARKLQAEVCFLRSDLLSAFRPEDCSRDPVRIRFDMIVSNPPYIRTDVIEELSDEVRLHEPRTALDGGKDGLDFYRRIIRDSGECLRPGGWLLLEIGYDQGQDVSGLMIQNGFLDVAVTKDLSGNDRVVSGRWERGVYV